MTREYDTMHIVATIIGALLFGFGELSNIEYLRGHFGSLFAPEVLASPMLGLGALVGLPAAMFAFRQRAFLMWAGLLCFWVVTAGYSFTATLSRVAEARADAMQARQANNPELKQLMKEIERQRRWAVQECRSGVGPKCKAARNEVTAYMARVEFLKAGSDSLAKTIETVSQGSIEARHAGLYQPLLLPLGILFGASFLFTFGVNGRRAKTLSEKVKEYVEMQIAVGGKAPSQAELSRQFGISKGKVKFLTAN